jgi:L-amino acid N-acyltransferase YncA
MSDPGTRYPLGIDLDGVGFELESMTAADEEAVLEFAKRLPPHDLLFLRRDITHPKVMRAWIREIEEGSIISLLARREGQLVGCSAVVRDELSWSPHVGELRVLVAPGERALGLGRRLIQESFRVALGLGLEKLVAQMTLDQKGAIAVFEELGFRPEALLRDHVRDGDGVKHDITILGHDVERFHAQMEAYGLTDLF